MEQEIMQSQMLKNLGIFSNYVLPVLVVCIVAGLYYIKQKMNWKVPTLKKQNSSNSKVSTSEKLILIDSIVENMYVSGDTYTGGIFTKDSDFFTLTPEEQMHASRSYINLFASSRRPFTKFVVNKKVELDEIQEIHVNAYLNLEKRLSNIRYSIRGIEDKIENAKSDEMLRAAKEEREYLLDRMVITEQLLKYAKEQIGFLDYASKINRGVLKQNYYFVSSDLNTADYKNLTDDEIVKRHRDSIEVELNGLRANLNNAYSKAEVLDDTQLKQVAYRLSHPISCDDTFNKFMASNAFSEYIYGVDDVKAENGGVVSEQTV
jgi:hypothetical protein